MTGRSAPREVTALIKDWIERENAAGKPFAAIALEVGVSKTQVQNVKAGTRGAGSDMEHGYAKRFHGGSIDELRKSAKEFCRQRFPAPSLEVDPLPKRAAALARLQGLLHVEVVHRVASTRYQNGAEMTEFEWVWTAVQEQLAYEREQLRKAPTD